MITIVDYGVGNVGAVANMFSKIGARARVASNPKELLTAQGILVPGVGHFDAGMRRLRDGGFVEPLNELVLGKKIPTLGICLGMQMFSRSSEEGSLPGLGWLAADTKKFVFPPGDPRVIPHMGWSDTFAEKKGLFESFETVPRFYYVHSYHVVCDRPEDVAATCKYGLEFTSSIRHGNLYGTQFHPEKSHRYGMTLLKSFVGIVKNHALAPEASCSV